MAGVTAKGAFDPSSYSADYSPLLRVFTAPNMGDLAAEVAEALATAAEMFAALMPDSRLEMSVETVVAREDALDAVVAADDAVDAVPVRLLTNADNGLPEPPTTSSINVCTSAVTPDMRLPGMASSASPSCVSV